MSFLSMPCHHLVCHVSNFRHEVTAGTKNENELKTQGLN